MTGRMPTLVTILIVGCLIAGQATAASETPRTQEGSGEAGTAQVHADTNGESPGPLDLDLVVALALGRNPGLKASEERRREIAAGVKEARSEAFPQLALVSSWSRSRNPTFLNSRDFESLLDQFPGGSFEPSEQELWRVSGEVTQPIYSFGKLAAAIELAETLTEVTEAEIGTTQLDTALTAAEAYYDLLASRRALAAVEAQEASRREALDVVEARFEIGEATLLERLRATSALDEVRPQIVEAQGRIEVAESRLRSILDLSRERRLVTAEPGESLPAPPPIEVILDAARRNRPEITDLELQRHALGRRQEVIASEGKPQIELTGRYGREVRLLDNLTDPLFADWAVAVELRWEFFDGGRRKASQVRLDSQRQQLAFELDDLRNQIVLEIEAAVSEYRTAVERWRAAEKAAETAREARRVAAETYREGVALQADLLDAQQIETAAEIVAIEAFYSAWTAAARLARAGGRLPTETDWTAAASSAGKSVEDLRTESPSPATGRME